MKAVIDTNIVLDILAHREPFFEQSQLVMQLVAEGKVEGSITANTITDIYYVLRKHLDNETLRTALRGLMELLEVVDVTGVQCLAALDLIVKDYEDALLACCAKSWEADYIITRNVKDFTHSPVKAMSPNDFLRTVTERLP
jgi:predicted nucleic acid-binding protein